MGATLHDVIAEAGQHLTGAGISPAEARLDAGVLARHVLACDAAALLVHGHDQATEDFVRRFRALVKRRAAREPVAYITGVREFWDREFEVTRGVLIPRPETELIVEAVLDACDGARPLTILDVGTGSGCLAVTLAAELPLARVVATDASAAALPVARRNADRYGVAPRVSFVLADLIDAVSGSFDVVVSNPPYVPSGEDLPPEVRLYEPPQALLAGPDGLDALRRLIPAVRGVLAAGGLFVVEFGFGQSDAVRAIAGAAGWPAAEMRTDLQGIPRVCVIHAPGNAREG